MRKQFDKMMDSNDGKKGDNDDKKLDDDECGTNMLTTTLNKNDIIIDENGIQKSIIQTVVSVIGEKVFDGNSSLKNEGSNSSKNEGSKPLHHLTHKLANVLLSLVLLSHQYLALIGTVFYVNGFRCKIDKFTLKTGVVF